MPLNDFRSVYLPYCLKNVKDDIFIVLNREYKPIGFNTRDLLNYEDYPIASRIRGITTNMIKRISYNGEIKNEGFIYLYNDDCIPTSSKSNMISYLEKLEVLASLQLTK